MSELDKTDNFYQSLSKPGQSYFYKLMSMCPNQDLAQNLQYVLKRRDMASKQGTLNALNDHLSRKFVGMNDSIGQDVNSNKNLDDGTRNKINDYFESNDFVSTMGKENLYSGLNKRHHWVADVDIPEEDAGPEPAAATQNPADLAQAEAEAFGQQQSGPAPHQQPSPNNPQQAPQPNPQGQQGQPVDPIIAQEMQQGAGIADGQGQGPQPAVTPQNSQPEQQVDNQDNSPKGSGQKRDTYSPEDINMIKEGLGLYQSLDGSGQRYFNANLNKARRAPKELDKIKNARPDQLKKSEVGYDDYLKNIAYGEVLGRDNNYHSIGRPVPTKDKAAIDNYFAKSVGMSTDNFGMVLNGIKEFQDKQRQKQLHKQYIPRMSELESAGQSAQQGVHLYDSLSKEGQQYFKTNFYEAKKAPNRFQQMKITPLADLTNDQRQAREKLRVTAQGEYFNHRGELVQGNDPVPDGERKSVDTYFKQPSTANAIAHGAMGSALLDYESDHVQQMRHPDKLTEAANRVSAKQGVNLYNNLTPEGQDYFLATLHQANNSPEKFYRTRQLPENQLTNKQRESRDKLRYAASGIYYSKSQGRYIGSGKAVPPDEKAQIDNYFNQKSTINPIKYDTLPITLRKSQRRKAQKLFDKQQHPVKYLPNDYKATDPARYNKMLETGADLFDNLSPKGRKYLLQSARMATLNLDDYNKALKGNPASLTQQQRRIKRSLDAAAGRMEAPNGQPVKTSPYALDDKEKSSVDRFLQDNVTQAGLAHGDTYDAIVLRNMQNRDLKETRADERANNPWVYYRHNLARRERRTHPIMYAIGYEAGYRNAYRREMKRIKRQQRNGTRPVSQDPLQNARQQMDIDRKGKATKARKRKFTAMTPKQQSIQKAFNQIKAHVNRTSAPKQHPTQQGPSMS